MALNTKKCSLHGVPGYSVKSSVKLHPNSSVPAAVDLELTRKNSGPYLFVNWANGNNKQLAKYDRYGKGDEDVFES